MNAPEPDAAAPMTRLPDGAVRRLRRGVPALCLSGGGASRIRASYSWAVAVDAGRLRFALDAGRGSSAELRRSGRASLLVVGNAGLNLLIDGHARRRLDRLGCAGGIGLEAWELTVSEVQDQSWPGVRTTALAYRWPAPERESMRALERAICDELLGLDRA